ncbi:transmembrane protein, putative [Medicago truncatula]|uniref:Transmembrane protein, putative n=1 Tax=Medicago truncatula TaxID=3880 RepID=A0A072VKB8_MEDTR|nr:transmembrane protein, putative [Medicago truncatula]
MTNKMHVWQLANTPAVLASTSQNQPSPTLDGGGGFHFGTTWCTVEFIRRQANEVAHTLARETTFLADPAVYFEILIVLKLLLSIPEPTFLVICLIFAYLKYADYANLYMWHPVGNYSILPN